jgi:hypothetical protein
MVAPRSWQNNLIRGTPQVAIARMRSVDFAELLVNLKLFTVIPLPGVHFQHQMLAFPGFISLKDYWGERRDMRTGDHERATR